MTKVVDLGYMPRRWQSECHIHRKRFTVLALHRRAGKSEWAIMELIHAALDFRQPLGLFFYMAPYLKQAKVVAWARLKERLKNLLIAGAVEIVETELMVRFRHNGAVIRIYGADNPDGMRGIRLDGCVIDEVAQIKPQVWTDIIQPTLADREGFCIFIGTPSGVNLFSELYYRAKELSDWHSGLYTCYDTEALPPQEIERLRRDMSEATFAREMLCDFTASGDDQLISLYDAEMAAQRVYKPGEMDYAPKILGVDPARYGDDRSVIFPRQGLQAFTPQVFRGLDNMELAARVAAKIEQWKPDAVFVDAGNGAGVIDRLRQLGHSVIEINFGGKPNDDHYANKRAEIWYAMREWLKSGGSIPNDVSLKQDLAAPTYWNTALDKIMLEPKDEIKKRGLPSPDLGDALALTFAQPVAKHTSYNPHAAHSAVYDPLSKQHIRHEIGGNNHRSGYDPFNRDYMRNNW